MVVVVLLLCAALPGVSASPENTDYDCYLGTYAYEATPYWPELHIVKDANEWTVQAPDSEWNMALDRSDGRLIAKEDDGDEIKLWYEPSKNRYIASTRTQVATRRGIGRFPETRVPVKLKPSPNELLEKKYGVTAPDLVRTVRAGEKWIHQIRSLRIKAKYKWRRTSRGIEHRKKEVKERWPEADLSRERFWSLCPEQRGELSLSFDRWRFRMYDFREGKSERLRIWNGREYVVHAKYYTHDQEYYAFRKEIPEVFGLFVAFMWPRSKYHKFWWNNHQMNDWRERYGRAEEFILVGKQEYREVPCYVIECYPKEYHRVRRWFVGIEDGLRYGDLVYEGGELFREQWTGKHKEVAPGWWFPMEQGYHILEHGRDMKYFISATRDISVKDVKVNEALPDELFVMEFKDGVKVSDDRFGGFVTYKYKKDRTEQEWEQIRQKAQERQERDKTEKQALDSRIGQVALDFSAKCKWIHTEPLTMEKLRGKAVVLQFWGVWCGSCHNYMGLLNPRADNENIVVIGVHTPEEDLSQIKADMDKYKATGPVCVEAGEGWGAISHWYHVKQRPYWVVIGPDGKVIGHSERPLEAFRAAAKSLPADTEK